MKFCLQSKLAEYCENDTEILLQVKFNLKCLQFILIFQQYRAYESL